MLFDLKATRRRRVFMRVTYSILTILMAASLFFVINGGVFSNAGNSSSNSGQTAAVTAQIKAAEKATKNNPNSANAWASLMQANYQAAVATSKTSTTGTAIFTAAGQKQLTQAAAAWNKYRTLQKGTPLLQDAQLAALALDDLKQYGDATIAWQDVVAQAPQSAKAVTCLAFTAYASKKGELGDAAAQAAIKLTPKLDRLTLQGYFTSSKTTTATAEQYITESGC